MEEEKKENRTGFSVLARRRLMLVVIDVACIVLASYLGLLIRFADDMYSIPSYFISSVDIYHYGGIKHSSLAPHSHTAAFSVKDWPRGLYLVVAHTPLGDITKKLVVE